MDFHSILLVALLYGAYAIIALIILLVVFFLLAFLHFNYKWSCIIALVCAGVGAKIIVRFYVSPWYQLQSYAYETNKTLPYTKDGITFTKIESGWTDLHLFYAIDDAIKDINVDNFFSHVDKSIFELPEVPSLCPSFSENLILSRIILTYSYKLKTKDVELTRQDCYPE